MTLADKIKKLREVISKATPGPYVFGYWKIFEEDREAQKRGDPFWTLVAGSDCLTTGPIGRKSLATEYIVNAAGYETDGLNASREDLMFIQAAINELPKLLDCIEIQAEALDVLTRFNNHMIEEELWRIKEAQAKVNDLFK